MEKTSARRVAQLGAMAGAVAMLLTSCSSSSGGEGAERVVMYSPNNDNANSTIVDAGKSADPALNVEVVNAGTTALLSRIQAEDGKNSADVYYSATPLILGEYADIFEPYTSPEAEAIPEELRQPDDLWSVQNTHVVAFMVNTDQLDGVKTPETWKDLTDPKLKGKIISADPLDSSTASAALYGAWKLLGDEDFAKLAQNLDIADKSDSVYPAVSQGEYAVVPGFESNIYAYIAGEQPGIELVYPEDGTFVTHEAVAVVKKAANPEGAKQLVDNILSKSTQEQLLQNSFRRPARTDIDVTEFVDYPKLEDLDIFPTPDSDDEDERAQFEAAWEAARAGS